jgi:hypothetical protein
VIWPGLIERRLEVLFDDAMKDSTAVSIIKRIADGMDYEIICKGQMISNNVIRESGSRNDIKTRTRLWKQ